MACLVYGYDQELAEWASRMIPHMRGRTFGPCRSIGIMRGNNPNDMTAPIQAVVVFHDYLPFEKTCQVSVASRSPMWAHRSIIAGILSYPFEQIGVNLLCCVMHHSNVRAIRFNEHLGFKRDAVLRHRLGWRQHAVVTSMTKYEYEKVWKNAKIRPVAAATA